MTKVFLRYFLFLSIFLLSGYAQLFAAANKTTHSNFPSKRTLYRSSACTSHYNSSYCSVLKAIDSEKPTHESELSLFENEEDETNTFKKHLKFGNYFTAILFDNDQNSLFNSLQQFSFSELRIFRSLSPRFLLLQVIKI